MKGIRQKKRRQAGRPIRRKGQAALKSRAKHSAGKNVYAAPLPAG